MNRKEIYWLVLTIAFTIILNLIIFGPSGFKSESTINVNIHDTYYVIANHHFIILLAVFTLFAVYLGRTLFQNFRNSTVNLILIITTIILSFVVIEVKSILDHLIQQTSGWTIYPPLSAGESEHPGENISTNLEVFSYIIFVIQVLLLILLAYTGFKTGVNYKNRID